MDKFLTSLLQLSLVLIGIVPLIYILTVSLLGRAIKKKKEEEEVENKKHEQQLQSQFEKADKKYKEMVGKKDTAKIAEAQASLDEIKKNERESKEKIKKIGTKYGKLTIKGSIVPFFWFVLAFIFILLAQGLLLNQAVTTKAIGIIYILFGAACIFIIIGLIKQYQIIKVIQEIAYPSEEVLMKLTVDAFKQALVEHDISTRPILSLEFKNKTTPFIVHKSENILIKFSIRFDSGDIAKRTSICFFAPPGFNFVSGKKMPPQDSEFTIPNAVATEIAFHTLLQGTDYLNSVEMKAPDQPGEYKLLYEIECERFLGKREPFVIKVI